METFRRFLMAFIRRFRPPRFVFDLLLVFAGFVVALCLYASLLRGGLTFFELLTNSAVSSLVFWLAVELRDASPSPATGITGAFERFCVGTGANLLLHALLTYGFFLRRTPFMIAVGGLFAAAFLSLWRDRKPDKKSANSRMIIVGFDSIAAKIAEISGEPVFGIIGEQEAQPAGIPLLGNVHDFEKIVQRFQPTHLLINLADWTSWISPSALLNCRYSGMKVEDSPALYERLFRRVSCERLQPMDLILSDALRGHSRTMAIQAVYTNLIALFFLLALSPLLLLLSAAVAAFSRPGPIFESVECAGFRYIPFRRLRFRTLNASGEMTRIGELMSKLHLVDLPQLINVVRGEMALVGPRPARRQFAYYLTELMPFYSHRFSVKPGIFGWAQMHLPVNGAPASECLQIEYDLYYIKEGSPWLDARILLDMFFGQASTHHAPTTFGKERATAIRC